MAIVIEFTGYAGSGKTYICERLTETFGKYSAVPSSIRVSIFDVIFYTIRYPYSTLITILFVFGTKQNNWSRNILFIKKILKYNIKLMKLSRSNVKYIFVDEGMLHRLREIRRT